MNIANIIADRDADRPTSEHSLTSPGLTVLDAAYTAPYSPRASPTNPYGV